MADEIPTAHQLDYLSVQTKAQRKTQKLESKNLFYLYTYKIYFLTAGPEILQHIFSRGIIFLFSPLCKGYFLLNVFPARVFIQIFLGTPIQLRLL